MLGLVLAVAASSGTSITLWQNVKLGMTFEQLRTAQPTARPIPQEEAGKFVKGCRFTSGDITVAGENYTVCYMTDGERVRSVHLDNESETASSLTFASLKAGLASKYGQPVLDECTPVGVSKVCKAVWKDRSVNISATYTFVMGANIIGVNYDADQSGGNSL